MKKIIASLVLALVFVNFSNAQKPKTIKLSQTDGKFEQTELKLKPGTYVFEVMNDHVDHEVGFVLVPKGATSKADHIKAAYLKKTVNDGESSRSGEVKLEKGEYEYFCPLNPTPHYSLIVN